MDPTAVAAPFLAQGAMGAAIVALSLVIWRLWTALQACQASKDAELKALLERVLKGLSDTANVVADNNKMGTSVAQSVDSLLRDALRGKQ